MDIDSGPSNKTQSEVNGSHDKLNVSCARHTNKLHLTRLHALCSSRLTFDTLSSSHLTLNTVHRTRITLH